MIFCYYCFIFTRPLISVRVNLPCVVANLSRDLPAVYPPTKIWWAGCLSCQSSKTAPSGSYSIIYLYKKRSSIYFDARFPIVTRSGVARNIDPEYHSLARLGKLRGKTQLILTTFFRPTPYGHEQRSG